MDLIINQFGGAVVHNCVLPEPNGTCEAMWNPWTPCPNRADWIVKNNFNQGYSIMCDVHREGFEESFKQYDGAVTYLPYEQPLAEQLYKNFTEEKSNG